MMKLAISALAAAFLLMPLPAPAQTGEAPAITDVSSQVTIRENRRGGVNVKVGREHNRRASSVRRHGRGVSRGAGRRCETVKTTRRVDGRTVTRTVRRCR
jgi:hypothetical protein